MNVNSEAPGREIDHYDTYCFHLGVFQGSQRVAYLRALPWQAKPGFMLHHEFSELLDSQQVAACARPGHVELSRLIVAPPPDKGRLNP